MAAVKGRVLLVLPHLALNSILEDSCGPNKKWPGDPMAENGKFWRNWAVYLGILDKYKGTPGLEFVKFFRPHYILHIRPPKGYGDYYPRQKSIRVLPSSFPSLQLKKGEKYTTPVSLLRLWAREKEVKWVGVGLRDLFKKAEFKGDLWFWLKQADPALVIETLKQALEERLRQAADTPRDYGVDLDAEPIKNIETEWLLSNKILPARLPCLLRGREGTGKTTMALFLASEVVRETRGRVLWIAAEAAYDTKQKRDIHFPGMAEKIPVWRRNGDYSFSLENSEDLEALGAVLSVNPDINLVILDSLRASLRRVKETEVTVGNLIRRFASVVCEKHGRTLLILHHEKKGDANKRDRFSGSPDIVAAVRWELIITPASQKHRILEVGKSNLPIYPPGPWGVVRTGNTFAWAEIPEAEETLSQRAERLIWDVLGEGGGKVRAATVYERAEAEGINPDLLKKVKKALGIQSRQEERSWFWVAPYKIIPPVPSDLSEGVTPCKNRAYSERNQREFRGNTLQGEQGEQREQREEGEERDESSEGGIPQPPLEAVLIPTPPPEIEARLDERGAWIQQTKEAEEEERVQAILEEKAKYRLPPEEMAKEEGALDGDFPF